MIRYQLEPDLTADEFRDVLRRSGLDQRRPVDEPGTLAAMLAGADIILTARAIDRENAAAEKPDDLLVGVSRAITDRAYCTYLSDLAVDEAYQRQGIGRELIQRTHREAGLATTLILLSAPAARDYYPHVGMQAHDSCWVIMREGR